MIAVQPLVYGLVRCVFSVNHGLPDLRHHLHFRTAKCSILSLRKRQNLNGVAKRLSVKVQYI